MNCRLHFKALLLFAAISFSFTEKINAQEQTFTLEEAVRFAMENNLQVQNSSLQRAIADQQVRETRAIGLPHLDGSVRLEYFHDRPVSLVPAEFVGGPPGEFMELSFGTDYDLTATLTLNQLIFDGQYIVALRASHEFRRLRDNQLDQVRRDIREQVSKAYYRAVLSREVSEILEQNIEQLEQTLYETEAMYENGFVERLDVDRIKLRVNQVKTEYENAIRQEQNAMISLKLQIGYPVQDQLLTVGTLEDYYDEEYSPEIRETEQVIRERIEHHVLKSHETVTNLDRQRYRAGYLPSLSAFATHRQNAQRDEFSFHESDRSWFPSNTIGLSLNVPIFDGFEKNAIIQQKNLELEMLRNERFFLEQSIFTEIEESINNYQTAGAQLENQRENLELARRIYDQTIERYREGIGVSRTVTEAQTDLNQAQVNFLNAQLEIILARVELEIANGTF